MLIFMVKPKTSVGFMNEKNKQSPRVSESFLFHLFSTPYPDYKANFTKESRPHNTFYYFSLVVKKFGSKDGV